MGFLSIDYDKAIAQAKKLDEAALLCAGAIKDLKKERNNSGTIWTGESGEAMRTKAEELEKELKNGKSMLASAAEDIRRVAYELRKEDERARSRIESFFS